jgi:hypothetical protein
MYMHAKRPLSISENKRQEEKLGWVYEPLHFGRHTVSEENSQCSLIQASNIERI